PVFTKAEVLNHLRDRCGAVSAVDPASEDGLNFYFPAYRVPFKDDAMPVQVAISVQDARLEDPALEKALGRTLDWTEAKAAAERHTAHVTLTDILAVQLEYRSRLGLFQNVLQGLMELVMPAAILWRASMKVVDPMSLVQALRPGDARNPLYGAVNVRRFKSADRPGRMLMDTLGLSAIGLPDFEVPFEGIEPSKIEAILWSLVRYQFDLGDVIADGRVFKVPGTKESWVCSRSPSRQPPTREVIALKPQGATTVRRLAPPDK
ncbi:MAG TPA: DUF4261 domain-containing protein, partial [Planctomycetota bacterium]|nr:DUF4261 domain-containing protein [Planctomycetota bacterium]